MPIFFFCSNCRLQLARKSFSGLKAVTSRSEKVFPARSGLMYGQKKFFRLVWSSHLAKRISSVRKVVTFEPEELFSASLESLSSQKIFFQTENDYNRPKKSSSGFIVVRSEMGQFRLDDVCAKNVESNLAEPQSGRVPRQPG
jgi:hypothetical protein